MVLNSYQELLNKSYSLMDEEQIDRIESILSQKKRIYVYGKGSSGLVGMEMKLRFMRIGVNLEAITDAHIMKMNSVLVDEDCAVIGISVSGNMRYEDLNFAQAALAGAEQTWGMVELTAESFLKLVQRVVPLDQVGGPIMIAQLVGEQAQQGLAGVLGLAALISINLAILNLLPIPILDGGTALFCLIEMIFRRPVNEKVQEWGMRVGLALLVCLMLLATYNDIARIITG